MIVAKGVSYKMGKTRIALIRDWLSMTKGMESAIPSEARQRAIWRMALSIHQRPSRAIWATDVVLTLWLYKIRQLRQATQAYMKESPWRALGA